MKKAILIIIVPITLVVACYSLIYNGNLFQMRSKAAAQKYIESIQAGDTDAAYEMVSPSFKKKLPQAQFVFVNNAALPSKSYKNAEVSLLPVETTDHTLVYNATLYVADNNTPVRNVILKMVKSGGNWYIDGTSVAN